MTKNLKQQINLYRPSRKFSPTISFEKILLIWFMLSMILLFVSISKKRELDNTLQQTKPLTAQQEMLNQKLHSVASASKNNLQVKAQSPLMKRIEKNENLIQLLKKEPQNKQPRLSAYLEGLILAHVKGTYLFYIHADAKHHQLVFQGRALAAQQVPLLIAAWQKNTAFENIQFKQANLFRVDAKKTWIQFDLRGQQ